MPCSRIVEGIYGWELVVVDSIALMELNSKHTPIKMD